MDTNKLHSLIKQTVNEELLREGLTDLEILHNNVSSSTMVGKPWFRLIQSLESVIDEVKDFSTMYSSRIHGPLPNTHETSKKLGEIVRLLMEIKPTIISIDDIQKKDI